MSPPSSPHQEKATCLLCPSNHNHTLLIRHVCSTSWTQRLASLRRFVPPISASTITRASSCTHHLMAANQSWNTRTSAVRGPRPCFLSPCRTSNDFPTKQTQIYGESDAALRWLEGFIDSTVLDHPAPVLDRQSVQLLQVSRKRRQRLSQPHPFRDELLDQTRPSSDERRSQPVAATLLLHCFVVGAGLISFRRTLRSTVWHGVSVVHDAAQCSGVLLVSQKLF